MEIVNPFFIVIGVIVSVLFFIFSMHKSQKYNSGKKVANTSYIKETPYYKKLVLKVKMMSTLLKILVSIAILITFIMLARPAKVQIVRNEKNDRDIILCMDVSLSVNKVNVELIKRFKEVVKGIEGDRVGIVIFNSTPIVYVPLTDDYEFVLEKLDALEEATVNSTLEDKMMDDYKLILEGTVAGSSERGSSLIGDGLASAIYRFNDLKKDKERTRIIIFSTDNDLNGTPLVSLDDAVKLCKANGIRLIGVSPEKAMMYAGEYDEYKTAVTSNGYNFYEVKSASDAQRIVDEVQSTKKTASEANIKSMIIDKPIVPVVLLILVVCGIIIIDKRMNV